MKSDEGINIELTVSTGMQMIEITDVRNMEYREAVATLQKSGLLVDYDFEKNDSVTKDYVISTNPEPGESLPAGSTVYMSVSAGPTTETTKVPNLIGLSQSAAASRIESSNLTLGSVTSVESDMPAGTVVWQSVNAYETVDEHTKIFIQVSLGPGVTADSVSGGNGGQ
jgi:beta-lactam-binding protein with PASTA domain